MHGTCRPADRIGALILKAVLRVHGTEAASGKRTEYDCREHNKRKDD